MLTDGTKTYPRRTLQFIFLTAILSFIVTLFLPYVGEEGMYTITSYEMWYHHHFLYPTIFGENYGRPPFLNWLIISLSAVLGWSKMLLASRIITALATLLTSGMLIWVTKHLFKNQQFAFFAGVVYLTGDVLLYHGWLAYSDPLFSLLIFAGIGTLWVASLEKRSGLVWIATICICLAFLTKALTAYIFYFTAFFVFMLLQEQRQFLLKPKNLFAQLFAVLFPLFWMSITQGNNGVGMVHDIFDKFAVHGFSYYLKQLVSFPLEVFLRFFPVSFLAVYFWYKKRITIKENKSEIIFSLWLIIILGFIPYWLVPNTEIRYVIPLYPLLALAFARTLWRTSAINLKTTCYWLIATVIFKYIYVVLFMPWYITNYRGNYTEVAREILSNAKDYPLFANDTSAKSLGVIATLDLMRYPAAPLDNSALASQPNYYVIHYQPELSIGKSYKAYSMGPHHQVYLLCHGNACLSTTS